MSPQTLILGTAMAPSKERCGTGQADLVYAANGANALGADLTVPTHLGARYRLTCCWLMSRHLTMLCFLQWHRSAASGDKVFTIQKAVRVILLCLSNLQKMRQNKSIRQP